MLGLMQDWPLLIHRIIDHAAKFHGQRKVVTRSIEGPIVETDYATVRARSLKVAQRLDQRRHQARRPGGNARLEHLRGTWKAGTASSASARSITPSIRACSPIRSSGSSTTPKTA